MADSTPTRSLTALETRLLTTREQFVEFVAARVADRTLAEDIVQDALLRAITAADGLRDEDRLVPWFYRILRNAIVDAYRRRDVQRRHTERLPDDGAFAEITPDEERALCECFRAILPSLRPDQAALIEAVELAGEAPANAAERLGITANNLKVRRHRARQALRVRLQEACRICADHGCLDCTCERAADDGTPEL